MNRRKSYFSTEVSDHIEAVGCFSTKKVKPEIYLDARSDIDWKTWDSGHGLYKTINTCAMGAQEKGLLYFGIECYGECRAATSMQP